MHFIKTYTYLHKLTQISFLESIELKIHIIFYFILKYLFSLPVSKDRNKSQ